MDGQVCQDKWASMSRYMATYVKILFSHCWCHPCTLFTIAFIHSWRKQNLRWYPGVEEVGRRPFLNRLITDWNFYRTAIISYCRWSISSLKSRQYVLTMTHVKVWLYQARCSVLILIVSKSFTGQFPLPEWQTSWDNNKRASVIAFTLNSDVCSKVLFKKMISFESPSK